MTALRIAVCAKQIPEPDETTFDEATLTIRRNTQLILDDSDAYGIETALQLAEVADEAEVILVSMAPNGETSGLRSGLAMGADRAVLVSDPALANTDALGTAKVLAAVLRRLEPDLVLAATESTDGYTGTVPVQVAELLGWPAVSVVRKVERSGDEVRAERQTEAGYDEVRCPLPCVITVTAGGVEPRYSSFKGITSARSKPVEELTLLDLGLEASSVGEAGGRQRLVAIENAEARSGGELIADEGDAETRIVAFLQALKVI